MNGKTSKSAPSVTPSRIGAVSKTTSLARAIGPALPLAVALAGGALAPKTTVPPVQVQVGATPPFTPAVTLSSTQCGGANSPACDQPYPMLQKGHPVDWWFVFKLNSGIFPGCAGNAERACPFGQQVQDYKPGWGQQYVYASSENPTLKAGSSCAGDTLTDPIGATFDEVYNGNFHYVVWNDQFYDDPSIKACTSKGNCDAPWGHSKGMLAWNDDGNGFVLQVSTPSWPASGSAQFPRKSDGNSLGCVKDDNVEVSQHFFALRLNKNDVIQVLTALKNSSVVTDAGNQQVVRNGGPADVQQFVSQLGQLSSSSIYFATTLSSGVELISKPSKLNVPPWQLVSAVLGGVSLRTANWWANPEIPSTDANSTIDCWSPSLPRPGPVEIATTGYWGGKTFGLTGGDGGNFNHAKIGVSTTGDTRYSIFGDMNQQGALSGECESSQNGRGGMFFVMVQPTLSDGISSLIAGSSASIAPTAK
jgi:hypothetical protein